MKKELIDKTKKLLHDTERYCREEAQHLGLQRTLLQNHMEDHWKELPKSVCGKIIKVNEALLRAYRELLEAEDDLMKGGNQ